MLKQLRNKKTAKKVWTVLAIIIVPAFVLWGSGSLIRSQDTSIAGRIFGKKITFLEYKDALSAVRNTAIMQFGDSFDEMQKFLNLDAQVWERLVLLYEAKRRRIQAADSEVIGLMQSYPIFQRKGRFDNKLYSEILQYVFHTKERAFEEQTRQNIIIHKLYKQVTDNIKAGDEEIKAEYRKLNEEISLYYIAAIPAEFEKGLSPSEEEIKSFFKENTLFFKEPVSFNLDYITFDSEDKARDVLSRLNKTKAFIKTAKDLGMDVKETGFISQNDPIPGIGWSPEILGLVSKLRAGEFSPPVYVNKNYYILRLKERKEAYIPDFEKIQEKVRQEFIKIKSNEAAKSKIEECLKQLKVGTKVGTATTFSPLESKKVVAVPTLDFGKLAKDLGLESNATALFKYGSYIEGIGASDKLWTAAENLKQDDFSEIISVPSGFYIIRLKERKPVDEKKFAEEKAEFSQQLLLRKKQDYFARFFEELSRKNAGPH